FLRCNGLMEIRIESARGVDRDQAVPLPELTQLLGDDREALPEVAGQVFGAGVLEGPLEIVEDGQEVVGEPRQRDLEVLLPLALAPLLVVLELGELADVPVLQVREILLDRPELVLRRRQRALFLLAEGRFERLARVADLEEVLFRSRAAVAVAVAH